MNLLRDLARNLLLMLVRLFYPVIRVDGRVRLPQFDGRPILFVVNHPNALLDPLLVQIALGRRMRFLAKSTLFNNPFGRFAMNAFGALPVYRQLDVAEGGGDTGRNEQTFARCRQALNNGESIALFPEGTSHTDPELKPLKTGAARIALSAQHEYGEKLGLVVLPVGLEYENRGTFRSRVVVCVGEPIEIQSLAKAYEKDERETVECLTETIREGLDSIVVQAETRELLDGISRIAGLTSSGGESRDSLVEQHARSLTLMRAYTRLHATEPERLEQIVGTARRYLRTLRALGIEDPLLLETPPVSWTVRFRFALTLLALLPAAIVGAVLGWVPYRFTGVIVGRLARTGDVVSTMKLLGGMLFILTWWLIETIVTAVLFGGMASIAVLVAAPLCGYAALRFDERFSTAIDYLRSDWIRTRGASTVASLAARRKELAMQIASALGDVQ